MAQDRIEKYSILAIGGSAGSLEVILKIIAALPVNNTFSVIIIVHRKNEGESILTQLLVGRTKLSVKEIEDKDAVRAGYVYIVPSDYHVLIEDEKIFSLDASEKVHHSRPSINVTFEFVAQVYGKAAIGVLLSGANADGATGLKAIQQFGGYTIVQNPATSEIDYMPQQALAIMQPDKILDADSIAEFLSTLLN